MNQFQDLFDRQKRPFATGVTRSYAWRIERLDRMAQLVGENEAALRRAVGQDFRTSKSSRNR
jgi:aldehyde dehydrogenase (NAD+)